jgi:hypothetical protein
MIPSPTVLSLNQIFRAYVLADFYYHEDFRNMETSHCYNDKDPTSMGARFSFGVFYNNLPLNVESAHLWAAIIKGSTLWGAFDRIK